MDTILENSPRTVCTIGGALVGAVIGLFLIGNFGVASGGGAFAVSGWILGMLIGGYIGFRVGEAKLKRLVNK